MTNPQGRPPGDSRVRRLPGVVESEEGHHCHSCHGGNLIPSVLGEGGLCSHRACELTSFLVLVIRNVFKG